MKRVFLIAILGVALAASASAGSAEDDLQAVKKALFASSGSVARPAAEDPQAAEAAPRPPTTRTDPMWFKVRIVEKAGKRARVSLNLPIGLARSLGEIGPQRPAQRCASRDRCGATLGELLRALDSGQPLLDIEDAEATVRVWLE